MEYQAALELEFYKNSKQYLQDIDNRLEEIEEEYLVYPHTYPDEESESIRYQGRSVEDAVIWKIEAEESLVKAKARIGNRCNRIERALSTLPVDEQNLLRLIYQDGTGYTLEGNRLLRQTLLKFYRSILREKVAIRIQKFEAHKAEVNGNLKEYLEARGVKVR